VSHLVGVEWAGLGNPDLLALGGKTYPTDRWPYQGNARLGDAPWTFEVRQDSGRSQRPREAFCPLQLGLDAAVDAEDHAAELVEVLLLGLEGGGGGGEAAALDLVPRLGLAGRSTTNSQRTSPSARVL